MNAVASAGVHQSISLPVAVVLRALIVEMVAELVPDHRADAAVIDRRIGVRIEERRLQDRGREDDLDHAEIGVGVDRHRGHAPLPAADRAAELADVVLMLELGWRAWHCRARRRASICRPTHVAPLARDSRSSA